MEEKRSMGPKDTRNRVVLFVAPFIVLPAVTLVLWSFGLIKEDSDNSGGRPEVGINHTLPSARNGKDSSWNKLRFYEQSDRDSARLKALARRDPYAKEALQSNERFGIDSNGKVLNGAAFFGRVSGFIGSGGYHRSTMQENEVKVRKKLSELESDMKKAEERAPSVESVGDVAGYADRGKGAGLGNRLSTIREQNGHDEDEGEDPQLKRLDGMLEKVLDIKYPDRMKRKNDSLATSMNMAASSGVGSISLVGPDSLLELSSNGGRDSGGNNGFFGLDDVEARSASAASVRAVIPGRPTLVAGSRVRLRLIDSMKVDGHLFESGTYVWGVAAFAAQRMLIHISSLEDKGLVIPVAISVYDLDGMAGVNAPGTADRDVAKQSTDQALQSLSIASMDESVGAQAATASIQAAKTLIGRKIKLVKVAIPENYEVILRDDNVKVNN